MVYSQNQSTPNISIPSVHFLKSQFQIFTILSVVIIIGLSEGSAYLYTVLVLDIQQAFPQTRLETIVIVIYALILALLNALGYYFWDIVKSAYMQIEEENENIQRGEIFHP